MSAIRNGLHDHLTGDATLTALLPDGAAGVFADAERPAGVSLPCVQIMPAVSSEIVDGDGAIDETRPIRVLAEATGDDAAVDAVADRVRALFSADIAGLMFSGYSSGSVRVSGPVEADPSADWYGRLISVRLILFPE